MTAVVEEKRPAETTAATPSPNMKMWEDAIDARTRAELLGQPFNWRDFAACRDAPLEIFIQNDDDQEEPVYPPKAAVAYCERCPVVTECLNAALLPDSDGIYADGVWGGTSRYQREQMRRGRPRARCPVCSSTMLIEENRAELCLSCGKSWRII